MDWGGIRAATALRSRPDLSPLRRGCGWDPMPSKSDGCWP